MSALSPLAVSAAPTRRIIRFFTLLHPSDHAGQGEIDDKINQARKAEQDKHIGYVHGVQAVIPMGRAEELFHPAHQLNGRHVGKIGRILDGGDDLT